MKKLSNTEADFKKNVAYKKKRVLWMRHQMITITITLCFISIYQSYIEVTLRCGKKY